MILASGTATLTFWLATPVCDSDQDFLEVLIDDNQIFLINGAADSCGTAAYVEQTVDLGAFADGGTHTLRFHFESFSANGGVSNFFLDDVALNNVEITAIEPGADGLPGTHALSEVYPNPFAGRASVKLEIAEQQNVRVEVFNALGQRVATLHDGALAAGTNHEFQIDASALASGVYLVRATGETFADLRMVTLTK